MAELPARRRMSPAAPATVRPAGRAGPSLRLARRLLRERGLTSIAGMDEVGRGALAGPVTVGVVGVTLDTRSAPPGLDDSKRLTPAARERLAPRLARWAPTWAVGHTSNDEIDAWGILFALRVAAGRALAALATPPELVILDGTYDYLHRPVPATRQLVLALPDAAPAAPAEAPPEPGELPPVELAVRADRRCAAVAAASVLAKVERDAVMSRLGREDPRWGWQDNKGYSAPDHLAALRRFGPDRWHRRTWRLPGPGDTDVPGAPGESEDPVVLDVAGAPSGGGGRPTDRR